MLEIWNLIPFAFLLAAVLCIWKSSLKVAAFPLILSIVSGFVFQNLSALSLLWIFSLVALGWALTHLSLSRTMSYVVFELFLVLVLLLSLHMLPGFNNLLVFNSVKFSEDSIPFNMYLNFDKTLAGLAIFIIFVKSFQAEKFNSTRLLLTTKSWLLLVIVLLPIAVISKYVKLDIKLPDFWWLWLLNNLFFVCFAEEALFRGLIQRRLSTLFVNHRYGFQVALAAASILFGLAHFKGGISYVLLSTIAGLFYGYAYAKTQRLESSMMVHFGLNVVHFFFFSYPALVQI